jgi:ketosteroid isomerase-like protein
MKKIILLFLFASAAFGGGLAGSLSTVFSPKAPLNNPADIASIKNMEVEIGDAMLVADIDKLAGFFADDWATVTPSGKLLTKENLIQDFKSGSIKLVSYALGPVDVQVLGNVAVCHSSIVEKRFRDGKDVSSEGVWMDLLEKRAGKWVVVRTEGDFVK